jgi:hypothetical protein
MIQTLLTDTAFRSIESCEHGVEIEIAPVRWSRELSEEAPVTAW